MAKATPVHVRLSRAAVDMGFLKKALETLHTSVVIEAVRENGYSGQQLLNLCLTIQEKLPYHEREEDKTA